MLEEFGKAIEDCDTAIKLDPGHTKSYFRKATALLELQTDEWHSKCIAAIDSGLHTDPGNVDLLELRKEADSVMESDSAVAVDDKER